MITLNEPAKKDYKPKRVKSIAVVFEEDGVTKIRHWPCQYEMFPGDTLNTNITVRYEDMYGEVFTP